VEEIAHLVAVGYKFLQSFHLFVDPVPSPLKQGQHVTQIKSTPLWLQLAHQPKLPRLTRSDMLWTSAARVLRLDAGLLDAGVSSTVSKSASCKCFSYLSHQMN
jgi:hypothetical protein